MASLRIIACIDSALEKVQSDKKTYVDWFNNNKWRWMYSRDVDPPSEGAEYDIMMYKLRSLETFISCSTLLGNHVQLRDQDTLQSRQNTLKKKKKIMNKHLGNLLVGAQDLLSRFMGINCSYPHQLLSVLCEVENLEKEMDEFYTRLVRYLQQYSTSPVADEAIDITETVLGQIQGFLSSKFSWYLVGPAPQALKEKITIKRNFIRFATLFCTDEHQQFTDLLNSIEAVAVSAGHLTLHLLPREGGYSDMAESRISGLLVRIVADYPLLDETYLQALDSLKHSRVDMNDDSLNKTKDFVAYILSTLWEMLQLSSGPVVFLKDELQQVYQGLRSLRTILTKHLSKLDEEIWDLSGAAICDAGVIILSLYQTDFAIDLRLGAFKGCMKVIRAKLEEKGVKTWIFGFPKTNISSFLDYLLEYSMEVESSELGTDSRRGLLTIRQYIAFLRTCILSLEDDHENHCMWNLAVELAYKIEPLIDQWVNGDVADSFSMSIESIEKDMETIKNDSGKIFATNSPGIKVTWRATDDQVASQSRTAKVDEVVGFETERKSILDRLSRGSKKLQVVCIVGMPGLGKTTLATKVYNDLSHGYHFQVCAWYPISQAFDRKKVLLDLLNHIQPGRGASTMTVDDLSQELWRSMKGRRYLIFLDDIWDTQAFDCLKASFPDDNTGSRILVTSRHRDVAALDESPHLLRHLTVDESLELLGRKLYGGRDWPPSTYGGRDWPPSTYGGRDWRKRVAGRIAESCKGLPLTIVVVAGLLSTTADKEAWENVLESLCSGVVSSTDQCQRTIELSYKHLPDHLKPCFLSFGAFPEDHEVSVKRLIWLWIAEGFVRKSESRTLEEVAKDYLTNLIGRSLVMKAKERSKGGVKACRIHDLLRDFCLRKAHGEHFSHLIRGHEELVSFDEPGNLRRLCIHSEPEHFKVSKLFCTGLRSLLFFRASDDKNQELDISFIFHMFKLLRVLDIEQMQMSGLPSEIGSLVHLRYLAIKVTSDILSSIGNLSHLQTLIVCSNNYVKLPDSIWNLRKLRHLYFIPVIDYSFGFILPLDNLENSCNFLELDSLSCLCAVDWDILEKQLRKFPNIRQLECNLSKLSCKSSSGKVLTFPLLSQLESLSLSFGYAQGIDYEVIFPEHIKSLTLHSCWLPWRKISRIAELPNLEVLKLLEDSFRGDTWHVGEGEFLKLKFLKLKGLDVVKWTSASDDQLPNLEKLVLERCYELEEIPECLAYAASLEMVEVTYCTDCVAGLMKKVEEYQMDMGNSALQVYMHSIYSEDVSSDDGEFELENLNN